jgi:SOS-response transcriptional repressor LexA
MAIGRLDTNQRDWWFQQAGESHAMVDQVASSYKKTWTVEADDNRTIQIHGTAGAGPNRFPPEQAESRISLPRSWFRDESGIVGLRVVGDSMHPVVQNGFLVLVDVHDNLDLEGLEGKMVAARNEHGVVIKWLRKFGDVWMLVSQNSDYAPIEVKKGGYALVGRVVKWIGEPSPTRK